MSKIILLLAVLVSLSCGCLITNCPRGGKRVDPTFLINTVVRECPTCGRDEQGLCFGSQICCGPNMGCLIGTPETLVCRGESFDLRPCFAGFSFCQGNSGRCAADGICCSQESCVIDTSCKLVDETGHYRKIGDKFGASHLENAGIKEFLIWKMLERMNITSNTFDKGNKFNSNSISTCN